MAQGSKRLLFGALSVAVSASLVAWLLSRIDLARAWAILRAGEPLWFLAALALTCCVPLCCVVRWKGVLRAQGSEAQLGALDALRAVLMANVLNSFLPSKGGDMAKAFFLRRRAGLTQGMGTVLLERLVDLFMLGLLGLGGYLASGAVWGLAAAGLLMGGVSVIFCVALFLPLERLPLPGKIRAKFEALAAVFRRWVRRPAAIAQTLAGSAGVWTLAALTVVMLTRALRQDVDGTYVFGIFPLSVLAGLVPSTVSGVGTRDAAFVQFLSLRISEEGATLVALGYTVFAYWLLSLISLPAVLLQLRSFYRARATASAEPDKNLTTCETESESPPPARPA